MSEAMVAESTGVKILQRTINAIDSAITGGETRRYGKVSAIARNDSVSLIFRGREGRREG